MKNKKIVIFVLQLIVIAAAAFIICVANPQTITGRCLVTTDGIYMIVDKNGSPIVMNIQSDNESLFDGLNSGDKIITDIAECVSRNLYIKASKLLDSDQLLRIEQDEELVFNGQFLENGK